MGKLKEFESLEEKRGYFSKSDFYNIDSKNKFDEWFEAIVNMKEEARTNFIFRGMKEAKHKLYTSAQRIWIQNDMDSWSGRSYMEFIDSFVQSAKRHPLINKVFDTYRYTDSQREFPILSILQHYGAPTPLMDWSYNINVALFFATETINGGHGNGYIDNYFSIYVINKAQYINEFISLRDFDELLTSNIMSFRDWGDDTHPNSNGIFYISDFDTGNSAGVTPLSKIAINRSKSLTSIYNQNIIPQEGLFIFNPFATKPIDEVFNVKEHSEGSNLVLSPFNCFNIKKDLADYVRRRIKKHADIDRSFIYPHLYDDVKTITNITINSFV